MNRDSINIIGSQRLIEMLCKINHGIAYTLLEHFKYKGRATISYLDFGVASDSVSFIYSNKLQELYNAYDNKFTEKVWKEKRSEMKVGKIIKMIFDDRFPINNPKGQPMPKPAIDIETFVNMFKAEREKNENYERFSIVKGEEIVYWYNMNNYTRFVSEDTPLGKSCLRYPESGKFLEMYLKNNDKISMLILKDDQGKLRGRAIVWNLDKPEGRTYLDRIYTVNDYDVELFKDYARRNGWLFKDRQVFGWNNFIVDGKDDVQYHPSKMLLQVQLTNKKIKYFPYLDTLSVFNRETGVACNNGALLRTAPHINLVDYQGSYQDEVDHREHVYSRRYDHEILREDAVYCQIDDDWAYEDDTVYIHNTEGLRALKNSDKIVKSKVLTKTKFFIKESCVWSDFMNTWIWKESVREAFVDPEKTQRVIIHFRLIGKSFIKDANGDFVKGEPKKEDKVVKKKSTGEKKSLFDLTVMDNGNLSVVMSQPSWSNHDPDMYSNEEEGNGSNYPLPRSIRRSNRPRQLMNTDFSNVDIPSGLYGLPGGLSGGSVGNSSRPQVFSVVTRMDEGRPIVTGVPRSQTNSDIDPNVPSSTSPEDIISRPRAIRFRTSNQFTGSSLEQPPLDDLGIGSITNPNDTPIVSWGEEAVDNGGIGNFEVDGDAENDSQPTSNVTATQNEQPNTRNAYQQTLDWFNSSNFDYGTSISRREMERMYLEMVRLTSMNGFTATQNPSTGTQQNDDLGDIIDEIDNL